MNDYDDDDLIYDMYSNSGRNTSHEKEVPETRKSAARVMGGMKASGVHTITVEADGDLYSVPKIEYITTLENNVKELRKEVSRLKEKVSRISNNYNKVVGAIKTLQRELNNKIDKR